MNEPDPRDLQYLESEMKKFNERKFCKSSYGSAMRYKASNSKFSTLQDIPVVYDRLYELGRR